MSGDSETNRIWFHIDAVDKKIETEKATVVALKKEFRNAQLELVRSKAKGGNEEKELIVGMAKEALEEAKAAQAKLEVEKNKYIDMLGKNYASSTELAGRVTRIEQEAKKRKINEVFSELDTLDDSEVDLNNVTGGTLTDDQFKIAHYALHKQYKIWDFSVDDLDEVPMKAQEHGFSELPALFERADSGLHVVDIQAAQQWNLSGAATYVDHHDRAVICNWRAARPDFLVLPSNKSAVDSKATSTPLLHSNTPIVFVEVQSGGKDIKFGTTHLRMALAGAHRIHARVYYGLFIQKGKYLNDAQLVQIDQEGAIWIDGDYSIAKVPALCKKLMESEH